MAILKIDGAAATDGQDDAIRNLPIFETQKDILVMTQEVMMVGDLPILRVIPQGTQRVSLPEVQQLQQSHRLPSETIRKSDVIPGFTQNSNLLDKEDDPRSHDISLNIHNDDGDWTLVTRRKKRSGFQRASHRRYQQSPLQIHASKLRQQRKCFRCLLPGHIQRTCRNPRRCLHCTASGHIIRDCPSKPIRMPKVSPRDANHYKSHDIPLPQNTTIKHPTKSSQHPVPQTQQPLQFSHNTSMAVPREWTTMIMNEGSVLWQQRPHSLDVYIAPREELSPANRFLEKSAFVFAGPAGNDPSVHRRISDCMGRHFHINPAEFSVFTIHQDFGDMILIFPTEEMAQAAIERASFYIGNNIEISLHPYSPQLQMAFDPLGGRARIHLYGLPLQHWNRFDMCTLVSGFGYPLRVAPYFQNGNYEYLTMFVACKKPEKIPFHLKLKVNPYKKKIRVEIDGWLDNQGPPPPPQNRGGGQDDRRYRGRGDHRDGDPRDGHNQQDASVNGGRDRGREQNRAQNRGPRHERSSSGSNWGRTASPWVEKLRTQLLQAGILSRAGEHTPIQPLKLSGNTSFPPEQGLVVTETALVLPLNLEEQRLQMLHRLGYSNLCFTSEIMNLIGTSEVGKRDIILSMTKGEIMGRKDFVREEILEGKGNSSVVIEELEEGQLPREVLQEVMIKGTDPSPTELCPSIVQSESALLEGPPPGFQHPLITQLEEGAHHKPIQEDCHNFSTVTDTHLPEGPTGLGLLTPAGGSVKRSARLKAKKSQVNYSATVGKRTYKKKCNKTKGAKLEYLNSLQPLDVDQAKLVINLAGVVFQGSMEEEVAKVVAS
ncbi:Gag polyprotein [Carex littledalei]|uniref:Gag polyprotein n=1 Tax=Carex littledalei TaxID=544730 RepID=A0A833VV34_9POAL|nr:Gag polyprotein [Carex littledalei]